MRGAGQSFPSKKSGVYRQWNIEGYEARKFLSKTKITDLSRQIAKVNHGEEITFEQILLTDNPPDPRLVIIDRQIADHVHNKQMDLLALSRPNGSGAFSFLVIEVKLGKNPELRDSVAMQLNNYVAHVDKYIDDYINCYSRNYAQQRRLGLLNFKSAEDKIEILPIVEGLVVVGGYSGIAQDAIAELKSNHPNIRVKEMRNSLVSVD